MAPHFDAQSGKLQVKGKVVELNDHVLVSAPWLDREGEPYLVARIIELLPPALPIASTSSSSTSTPVRRSTIASSSQPQAGSWSTTPARVRVNYYLRPRDITSRYVADFRLVVATMHADVIPISYIRCTCTVQHKEHITDMGAYKVKPDAFYWSQVYDRYLHRYFDAVPVNKVQNAPPDVVKHLTTHFEFILCEPSMSNELCDAQRGCSKCSKWAANADSVTCARCVKVFHLGCVDPPLAQKPKAGWAWACAPCARAHEDEVDAYMETGIAPTKLTSAPKSTKPNGKGIAVPDSPSKDLKSKFGTATPPIISSALAKGKGKDDDDKPVPNADSRQWRMMNGWPFRYFGMHTPSNSVLDPHDSIYPRTGTRLGHRYQITVPPWDYDKNEQEAPAPMYGALVKPRAKVNGPSGLPKVKKKLLNAQTVNRGEDDEVTIIAKPSLGISEEDKDEAVEEVKRMILYRHAGVDTLDKVLSVLSNDEAHDVAGALDVVRKMTQSEFGFPPWTEADRKKLADGVHKHLNDIDEIRKTLLPHKKMRDVVKRYYIYLGHLVQEDVPAQMDERTIAASASSPDKKRKNGAAAGGRAGGGAGAGKGRQHTGGDDSDGESVIDAPKSVIEGKKAWTCSICDATSTPKWYLCPDTLNDDLITPEPCVMCEECGIRWRHYGIQYAPSPTEDLSKTAPLPNGIGKSSDFRVRGPPTDAKGIPAPSPAASVAAFAPPKPAQPVLRPCLLCKRIEPKRDHASCLNCGMTVHSSCYGIPSTFEDLKKWICDLCDMEEGKKASLKARQPVCLLCPPRRVPPASKFTALDCMKLTEFDNYIHLLCAVWHPELKMTVPAELGDAEGISSIPSKRRLATCILCKKEGVGACVKCAHCPKMFHVSCAWLKQGYKFGFEVHPLRKKRSKDVAAIKFKDEEGEMRAVIWCSDHALGSDEAPEQALFDLGQRDPTTKLTAMQTYVRSVKSNPDDTFMLLRRARKLDAILEPVLNPAKQNLPTMPPGTSWSRDSTLSPLPESPSPRKVNLHEVSAQLLGSKRARYGSNSSDEESDSTDSYDPPIAKRVKAAFSKAASSTKSTPRDLDKRGATASPMHRRGGTSMDVDDESEAGEHIATGSTTPKDPWPTWRYSFAGLIARLNKARRVMGLPANSRASASPVPQLESHTQSGPDSGATGKHAAVRSPAPAPAPARVREATPTPTSKPPSRRRRTLAPTNEDKCVDATGSKEPDALADTTSASDATEEIGTRKSKRKRVLSEAARDAIAFEAALAQLENADAAASTSRPIKSNVKGGASETSPSAPEEAATEVSASEVSIQLKPNRPPASSPASIAALRGMSRATRGRYPDAEGMSTRSKQSRSADANGSHVVAHESPRTNSVSSQSSSSSNLAVSASGASKSSGAMVVKLSMGGKTLAAMTTSPVTATDAPKLAAMHVDAPAATTEGLALSEPPPVASDPRLPTPPGAISGEFDESTINLDDEVDFLPNALVNEDQARGSESSLGAEPQLVDESSFAPSSQSAPTSAYAGDPLILKEATECIDEAKPLETNTALPSHELVAAFATPAATVKPAATLDPPPQPEPLSAAVDSLPHQSFGTAASNGAIQHTMPMSSSEARSTAGVDAVAPCQSASLESPAVVNNSGGGWFVPPDERLSSTVGVKRPFSPLFEGMTALPPTTEQAPSWPHLTNGQGPLVANGEDLLKDSRSC